MNSSTLDQKPAFVRKERYGGGVYNEAAFRYFLARERRRAERANHPLVLVLVKARPGSGPQAPGAESTSAVAGLSRHTNVVFSALNACVREVDFVGWYREGAIASALVSVGGTGSGSARQTLHARVTRVLGEKLPINVSSDSLRVRVIELGRKQRT